MQIFAATMMKSVLQSKQGFWGMPGGIRAVCGCTSTAVMLCDSGLNNENERDQ